VVPESSKGILIPVGHDAMGIHKVLNGRKYCFEVVLFRFPPDNQVKMVISILLVAIYILKVLNKNSVFRVEA
jgi:hypothetical protein